MKKLLILSGKGGTGKTTTAAAFIRFAGARSVADCDVDAPNLALVSGGYPETRETDFKGSDKAKIYENLCIGCGKCAKMCRFGAISPAGGGKYAADELRCEGCGLCTEVCPVGAARLDKDIAGSLRVRSGDGVFADAELRMGRGNSGKLVTEVKRALYDAAGEAQLAIIDGSPGVGCPVMASMNGVSLALIVTEPSVSGFGDMQRLVRTASMARVRTAVCVNRSDVSPELSADIERWCAEQGVPFLGRVPFDRSAQRAINEGRSVADMDCPARAALYDVFIKAMELLDIKMTDKETKKL